MTMRVAALSTILLLSFLSLTAGAGVRAPAGMIVLEDVSSNNNNDNKVVTAAETMARQLEPCPTAGIVPEGEINRHCQGATPPSWCITRCPPASLITFICQKSSYKPIWCPQFSPSAIPSSSPSAIPSSSPTESPTLAPSASPSAAPSPLPTPQPTAAGIQFKIMGIAGEGLLPGNWDPAIVSTGSGGEIGDGVYYNPFTKILSINIGWGSSQGFTDLSSPMFNDTTVPPLIKQPYVQVHGPTSSVNGNGFTETANPYQFLTPTSTAATGGSYMGDSQPLVGPLAPLEVQLLTGRGYLNIRTNNYPNGELRGFLVPVAAPIIQFNIIGIAGPGLLPGNWGPTVVSSGSGGEVGAGVFYNLVTKIFTINIGWGSLGGFTNLTSSIITTTSPPGNYVTVHGPTPSVNGNGYTEIANPLLFLNAGAVGAAGPTGGKLSVVTPPLTSNLAFVEGLLLAGKGYLNIRTTNFPNGELRGFLVPVV